MDLNLDTLEARNPGLSGGLATWPSSVALRATWTLSRWCSGTAERFPDYQMFLDTARRPACKLILFAAREFEAGDIDDLLEQIEEAEHRPRRAARLPVPPARSCASMKASPAPSSWPSTSHSRCTCTNCSPTGTTISGQPGRRDRKRPGRGRCGRGRLPWRVLLQELVRRRAGSCPRLSADDCLCR